MKLDILPIGLYEENSYILHEDGHVLFIDPGRFAKELIAHVKEDEVVDGIVLTHGHEDHTGAVDDLVDHYGCKVYMHSNDLMLTNASLGVRKRGYEAPIFHEITPLTSGDMEIGTFHITVYETPGHTSGSCLIRYKQSLFTGDTLFKNSIGRTDLFGGNEMEMMQSLRFIQSLPNDLTVYPGHGPSSSIAKEKRTNPYLQF